jgi:hypothetical protein
LSFADHLLRPHKLEQSMTTQSEIVLTLDIDWAPDWMIEDVARRLHVAQVKATWFATHPSEIISRLSRDPLFEIGAHPNFLPGSTQGDTPHEVLATMRKWLPAARAVRTHSLFQSEPLLQDVVGRFGFEIDCSIHLPQAEHVTPHAIRLAEDGPELIRIPHIFQDNMYMIAGLDWRFPAPWLAGNGLKVLVFHPIHIIANSRRLLDYEALKRSKPLAELKRSDFPPAGGDDGIGHFFDDLLGLLASRDTRTISGIADAWVSNR